MLWVCLRHEVRNPRLPDKPVSFWLPRTRLVTCYAQSRVSPIVTQLQDCNDSAAQNGCKRVSQKVSIPDPHAPVNFWTNEWKCFCSTQMLQADSGQLYSSAMQGLSSYANNIMGHTMNQYAAQSSLLSTQVVQVSHFRPTIQSLLICSVHYCRYRRWTTTSRRRGAAASQAPEEPHHQRLPMAWAVVRLLEVRFHVSATKLYYSAKLFSWEGWLP